MLQQEGNHDQLVKDFMLEAGGNTFISKVLIANNGMAAVKAIRSIRKWSYETFGVERAITFTAMATPEDLSMNAEYIRMADHFIQVPGGGSHFNYSNVDLIVDIARRTQVHAVWVGWGFASENPILAERLAQLNPKVVFVGPPPSAMRSLGDKIASTIVAQSAKVPCVDWSGMGLSFDSNSDNATVPDELYQKATITSAEEGLVHAERIGFPVMAKASEGGGGKGIRLIYNKKDFKAAFNQVQREVPGSPIFIMQVVQNARHLEVQLLADTYGNAIAIFGRDCSVQRRHQKIIEEAPVTIAPPNVLRDMEQSAVNLAKLVGYVSAGTVEYLYEPSTGKYYFLELNPRLQVEHPTTEMVSGVNIPAAQIQIAMGIPMSNIKDIRILYGMTPTGRTPIDFDFSNPKSSQIQRVPIAKGHVIATRITAENPDAGFKPNMGKFLELNFKSNSNVWGYFSVNVAGGVHEYADSQFGHLFAYGESREEARKNIVMALKEISIRGDFRTTVEYLVELLETEDFKNNTFTTSWLDKLISENNAKPKTDRNNAIPAICGSIGNTFLQFNENTSLFLSALQKGKVLSDDCLVTSFKSEFIINNISYDIKVLVTGPETYSVTIRDISYHITAKALADGGILVILGGISHVVYLKEEAAGTILIVDGTTYVMEKEHDPTELRSPSPGKLIRYMVKEGDHLLVGDAYAEIEPVSSTLSTGDVIGRLQLDDPSAVKKAVPFNDSLPTFSNPLERDDLPHHQLRQFSASIDSVLLGFEPECGLAVMVEKFSSALQSETLPVYELSEVIGSISTRIPQTLGAFLYDSVEAALETKSQLDFSKIEKTISESVQSMPLDEQDPMWTLLEPLNGIIKKFADGVSSNYRSELLHLLQRYYDVERLYENGTAARVILNLRDTHKTDLDSVVSIARAATKSVYRTDLMLLVLEKIRDDCITPSIQKVFSPLLEILANLTHKNSGKVSYRAREILTGFQLPSIDERKQKILKIFNKVSKKSRCGTRVYFDFSQLSKLILSRFPIIDILPDLFFHDEMHLRAIALYTYVMRTNQAYSVLSFEHHFLDDSVIISWDFASQNQNIFQSSHDLEIEEDLELQPELQMKGAIFACVSFEDVVNQVEKLMPQLAVDFDNMNRETFAGYVTIVFHSTSVHENPTDEVCSNVLREFVEQHAEWLGRKLIRRITFMLLDDSGHPRYITFKESIGFKEDLVVRNIEPFMSHRLELERLSNFDVKPCSSNARGLSIYHAVGKKNPSDVRFFIRGIVHPNNVSTFQDFFMSEGNRITTDTLNALELLTATHPNTDCNHVLLHFIPVFNLTTKVVQSAIEMLMQRHRTRLSKLRVTEVEICYLSHHPVTNEVVPFRWIIEIKSEYVIRISWYSQQNQKNGDTILQSLVTPTGPHHNEPVLRLHSPKAAIQPKRYKAHLLGTTYVYDFPALFEEATKQSWLKINKGRNMPLSLMKCVEMALNSVGELEETDRPYEYPRGREVIIISNDITYQMGSFGPTEDLVFLKASQYARSVGVPRVYLSANSGARIGLADEILNKYKIAWLNSKEPQNGFDYLYLDESDYRSLNKDSSKPSVSAIPIVVDGEIRYKLDAIIGQQHGLGVENLQGSGMIAGETSQAYKDIFTITLVTCRSVGIGAYLVRLGQRVIQVDYSPIILTGAGALNKVLGRQVYSSNLQLGGTRIMHPNGVSHLCAANDFNGVVEILNWLGYVPERRDSPLPIMASPDPVDRPIDCDIPSLPYDPRNLLQGHYEGGEWKSGFFDKGSFKETLSGWAKGVVVGRGRLGGIPMGCIAVETRTTETVHWADPAVETSQEETTMEAGQVWYPNSAYKTAQAINDFNHGEQLPLIIFANWRGFSGGQSDMSKEVLKFGAQIVDALRDYKQPIFIYVVGELRGGAWVVVDPSINPEMMEMYCHENARGGVLEPQGIVEIKYRTPKIVSSMERLDPNYRALKTAITQCVTEDERKSLAKKIKAFEQNVLPAYEQAAVELADLHDRPQRMLTKNVIKEVIPWKESRAIFYWRLMRKLREQSLIKSIQKHGSQEAAVLIAKWSGQTLGARLSDKEFLRWLDVNRIQIDGHLSRLEIESITSQMVALAKRNPSSLTATVSSLVDRLSAGEKQQLLALLQ
ncbi:acetyl-coenzyme-A carboxylase [Globomyces sp. JEL0801]|nr:acetyl-coenzyme-A carboxylase [Globomyces sp. JEL0801]